MVVVQETKIACLANAAARLHKLAATLYAIHLDPYAVVVEVDVLAMRHVAPMVVCQAAAVIRAADLTIAIQVVIAAVVTINVVQ